MRINLNENGCCAVESERINVFDLPQIDGPTSVNSGATVMLSLVDGSKYPVSTTYVWKLGNNIVQQSALNTYQFTAGPSMKRIWTLNFLSLLKP
jgi:hypothetical protein